MEASLARKVIARFSSRKASSTRPNMAQSAPIRTGDRALVFVFAQGAESVQDGHVRVIVLTACLNGSVRNGHDFLVASRSEQSTAEKVIGALAVALAFDGLFDHAHGFIVEPGGIENPGLADLHFGQVPTQGHGLA